MPERPQAQLDQVSILWSGWKTSLYYSRYTCLSFYLWQSLFKRQLIPWFCGSLKKSDLSIYCAFVCGHYLILSSLHRCSQTCDKKELELIKDIKTQIKDKENVFFDMEAYLPKKNGSVLFHVSLQTMSFNYCLLFMRFLVCFFRLYLNLVLGNVNVTLLSNQAK